MIELENLVCYLRGRETRMKECKKRLEQDINKNLVALKVKKGKAKIELSTSYDDEKDDPRASLLVKCFKTFLKTKEGEKFLRNKKRQSNNRELGEIKVLVQIMTLFLLSQM